MRAMATRLVGEKRGRAEAIAKISRIFRGRVNDVRHLYSAQREMNGTFDTKVTTNNGLSIQLAVILGKLLLPFPACV